MYLNRYIKKKEKEKLAKTQFPQQNKSNYFFNQYSNYSLYKFKLNRRQNWKNKKITAQYF